MEQTLKTLIVMACILSAAGSASALRNPAAVYCDALGHEYVVNHTDEGDYGYCRLPGGEIVDAWKFLQGEIAPEESYCTREGYGLKIVEDYGICGKRLLTDSCAFCVLEDGGEKEVTELMGLSFHETECGDGRCGLPEDYGSCPQDCQSGGMDEYCDNVADGVCDSDCGPGGDPDCGGKAGSTCMPTLLLPFTILVSVISLHRL
ncbi:MAG: DUF333 domain-containing protein [Candidatus Altiarchaeota archaeon]